MYYSFKHRRRNLPFYDKKNTANNASGRITWRVLWAIKMVFLKSVIKTEVKIRRS